jgi:PBSX family phage terminase large subunit
LWLDSIPKLIELMGIKSAVEWRESDHYILFPNGSEIWVDGLDDRDRVDKILGREYATIYLNEVSQIAYPTVTTVLTRLAQNVEGLRNKAYFDCNPPSKHHWTYKLFIEGVDPETDEPVGNMGQYANMRINPGDNAENLPDGYIEEFLEHLPEDKRRRFLLGEYGDSAGAIFTNWETVEEIPDEVIRHSRRTIGLDFGFSVDPAACVDVYVNGDDIYLDELIYDRGLTNQELATRVRALGIQDVGIVADSAEPKSIHELRTAKIRVNGAEKGPDSVRAGVDWLRSKRLYVTRRSVNLIAEFQEYVWSQNRDGNFEPKPIDDYNHAIDAIRYAVDPMRRHQGATALTFTL